MPLTVLGQYAKGLAHHNAEDAQAIQNRRADQVAAVAGRRPAPDRGLG